MNPTPAATAGVGPNIVLERVSDGGLLFMCRGHLTAAMTPYVRRHLEPMLAQGKKPALFFDMFAVESYESAARQTMTDLIRDNRGHVLGVHVLFSSRIVAMGVAVANVMLGGNMVSGYSEKTKFYVAVDDALGKGRQT